MTDSQQPLPQTETGLALLKKLKLKAGDTLHGLALSSGFGDDKATEILCKYIVEQQKKHDHSGNIKTLLDRSFLADKYAHDKTVPIPLRILFTKATELTGDIAADSKADFCVASPDAHHFAATLKDDVSGEWEIQTTSLANLPRSLHFATLLMNPINPLQPVTPIELPLQPGRMEEQVAVIAAETDLLEHEILKGALVNAMHIAAWRYNKPLTQEQVPIDHFLKVARRANHLLRSPWNDQLFVQALDAVQPK